MRTLFYFLVLSLLVGACAPAGSGEQAAEGATQYTLTAFTPSKDYPEARLETMQYMDGNFNFFVSADEYKLGAQTPDAEQKMCANSGKGQHLHVIVDNAPYMAKYEANFAYEMPQGEHYILSFLSRSYHESIKRPAAKIAQKVTVEGGQFAKRDTIAGPMLFYSRPKGTYVGEKDTKKVMLDFYLVNASIGADYKVKAEINGEEHLIDTWQPYYIEGLPMGENKVKLTLVDKEGNAVDAPLNPVERTFTLKADPADEQ